MPAIPLIDIFAGPGGLGEGFAALRTKNRRVYRPSLAIEKDPAAHRTLKLRAFTRQFPDGRIPPDYYAYLRGQLSLDDLYAAHPKEHQRADAEAWCAELGHEHVRKVRDRIAAALGHRESESPWVLLGGPPCQPFSLAGRARNAPGSNTRYSDGKETRHTLYREYLQILADHWPAVFVMENVRGLLSARFDGEPIFPKIKADLEQPASVVGRNRKRGPTHKYNLYPISPPPNGDLYPISPSDGLFDEDVRPQDFLVRCEQHGVPQARHRLILVGVRDDITAKPARLEAQPPIPARRVLDDLPPLRGGLNRDDSPDARNACLQEAWDAPWLDELHRHDATTAQRIEAILDRTQRQAAARYASRGADFIDAPNAKCHYRPDWYHDPNLPGVVNHQTRGHMPSDLHRYLFAACFAKAHGRSPKLTDFPPRLLPNHQSAKNPTAATKFADRFRVQLADRPATTIVSHIAKDGHYYVHPDPTQCRSLTVREAARLQTFLDNYKFVGNRTEQYHQVGNAVPPLLAA